MAIYHCSFKIISRSKGQSAVASAAYQAGEKLYDQELAKYHDYTRKDEVIHSEIILPANAPEAYQDRATLWNAVQDVEAAKNARFARSIDVALPNELPRHVAIAVAQDYAAELAQQGMCVDMAVHWNEGNHHAHLKVTTRAIKEDGEWAPKSRKVYDLDENGNKIPVIDKKTGEQKVDAQNRKQWKSHKEDYTDWNTKEKLMEWRELWAECCNRYLEPENQISHLSLKDQGIDREPTIHEGYASREMEERGMVSDKCQFNRDIREANDLKKEMISADIDCLRERRELMQLQDVLDKLMERWRKIREQFKQPKQEKSIFDRSLEENMQKALKEAAAHTKVQPERSAWDHDR